MYNPKSCNALEKPFYTPVEAALRWCNLITHEADILARVDGEPIPPVSAFPQWPCLRANAEKIMDAILNHELSYGRDGKSVPSGEQVNKARLTVRHTDLKAWMAKHYPDQKPPFLFDEIERTTHAAITVEALQALQADRDALKARVEKAEHLYRERWSKLETERDEWRKKYEKAAADTSASPTHRGTLLVLIGALCQKGGIETGRRGAAQRIRELTEQIGTPVDDETIRKVLADIPDALESRSR